MKRAFNKQLLVVFLVIIFISGCALFNQSKYDKFTHENFAFLKAPVIKLYESYASDEISKCFKKYIFRKLDQFHEYEKWKEGNENTVEQIVLFKKMLTRHFEERNNLGVPWSEVHMQNKLNNVLEAIDLMLRTEMSKNK